MWPWQLSQICDNDCRMPCDNCSGSIKIRTTARRNNAPVDSQTCEIRARFARPMAMAHRNRRIPAERSGTNVAWDYCNMEERSSHLTVVVGASTLAEDLRRLLVQCGVAHAGVATHLRGLRKSMLLGENDLVIVCIALDQNTLQRHGDSLRRLLCWTPDRSRSHPRCGGYGLRCLCPRHKAGRQRGPSAGPKVDPAASQRHGGSPRSPAGGNQSHRTQRMGLGQCETPNRIRVIDEAHGQPRR